MCLQRAANIVRQDMFAESYVANGSFSQNCQRGSIPQTLLSLVNMILEGPKAKRQSTIKPSQAALPLAQLLTFNSVKHTPKTEECTRHVKSQETLLPVYVGVMLHLKTRKRDLMDRLHSLGLSISHDEVLRVSSDMANAVCEHLKETDTVCPSNLKTNVFTTAAVDNIDHSTSSTMAVSSFHGSSISLIQYPTVEGEGVENASFKQRNVSASKTIGPLPLSYTNIPPLSSQKQGGLRVPSMQCNVNGDDEALCLATMKETGWLNHMRQYVEDQQQIDKEDMQPTVTKQAGNGKATSKNATSVVSWSAFHGERQKHVNAGCQSSLLPLFAEVAHSIAMIKHAITVFMKAVEHLNPGQAAVIAFDQPLYVLAKQIQWGYPDSMGEDKLVVMLGGLHLGLAVLKAIGSCTWLESGWTEAVAQAGRATTGRVESLVTSAHAYYSYKIRPSSYDILALYTSTEGLQELLRRMRGERSSIPRASGAKIKPVRSHSSNSGM